MSRTIYDLDSIIEHLALEDCREQIDRPFAPEEDLQRACKGFDAALCAAGLGCSELEDAAGLYASASGIAGFSRGFRAGARLILDLIAGNGEVLGRGSC